MGSQGERDSLVTLVTLVTLWTPYKKGANFDLGEKRFLASQASLRHAGCPAGGVGLAGCPRLAGCASARRSGGVSSARPGPRGQHDAIWMPLAETTFLCGKSYCNHAA